MNLNQYKFQGWLRRGGLLLLEAAFVFALLNPSYAQTNPSDEHIVSYPMDNSKMIYADPVSRRMADCVRYAYLMEDVVDVIQGTPNYREEWDQFIEDVAKSQRDQGDAGLSDRGKELSLKLLLSSDVLDFGQEGLTEEQDGENTQNISASTPGAVVASALQLTALALENEGRWQEAFRIYNLIFAKNPKLLEYSYLRIEYRKNTLQISNFFGFLERRYPRMTQDKIDEVIQKVEEAKRKTAELLEAEKDYSLEYWKKDRKEHYGMGAPVYISTESGLIPDPDAFEVYQLRNMCSRMACPMLFNAYPRSSLQFVDSHDEIYNITEMAHYSYQVFLTQMEKLYERALESCNDEKSRRELNQGITLLRKLGELPF